MRASSVPAALLSAALTLPCLASAQPAGPAAQLDRVVVTSGPLRGVVSFNAPASVSQVAITGDEARTGVHVSELLGGVPGLVARDRGNFAQDLQLSLRGFGARSTFGVRGLRLYADGIPATMPDGQGQVSHFALAGAERVEVLRGPFSALHGNSSGGVLQLWTADGEAPTQGHVQAGIGRDDSRMLSASLRGAGERAGHALSLSRFDSDGWRDHAAARRTTFNGKWHLDTGRGGRLQLVANVFDAPDAQDPLGLTRAQVEDDPRQATAAATQFDTRKSVAQRQLGLSFEQPFGAHALRVMAYGGRREVEQYLALPVAAQANPLNAGGVIDLDGRYGGIDLRWNWSGQFGGRPFELAIGSNADAMRQHRRGYENFVGPALGVRGALRRDERNRVDNLDQYAQAWWRFAPRWALQAGVRHSRVAFAADDAYITAGNPDDSGRVRYTRTTPVAGVVFSAHEDARIYLSAGRGFETPTFNELGYRADGGAGLAFDLRPATSRNLEFGAKWRTPRGMRLEAALFRAATDDEIAVARNVAGRSSFRNVGRSLREGVELGAMLPFADAWSLQLAWTWIDARFRDGFPLCTPTGCSDPVGGVPAGTPIPGVPRQQLFARLQWQHDGWRLALETQAIASVPVNDRGSERAPGHALAHAEASRQWRLPHGSLRAFVRIDNLLDRRHIGSVIVNEGNGRFYEPGAGRGVLAGLRWQWAAADNR